MPEQRKDIMIEDARITFRNFTGMERQFNSEGDRNFSVLLDPVQAKELKDEGWRVKQLRARDEEDEGDYHMKVIVNYKKGRPPRVVLVTSRGRTELGADEVGMLDTADIKKVDMILNGWWSDMAGGGYSAYLKTMFVTINEDALELKYGGMPADDDNIRDDDIFNEGVAD